MRSDTHNEPVDVGSGPPTTLVPMHQRWLAPSILGLAALCAALIGGWALAQGVSILALLPAVALVAAMAAALKLLAPERKRVTA